MFAKFVFLLIPQLIIATVLIGFLILSGKSKEGGKKFIFLFLLLIAFDYSCLFLPKLIPYFDILNGKYNWDGKLFAFIAGVIFIIIFRLPSKICYITLKQNANSLKRSVVLSVSWLAFSLVWQMILGNYKIPFSYEAVAFQLTMPGLHEEFVYRGIMLGLLNCVFQKSMFIFKINFGWALLVISILFGVSHGFVLNPNFTVQFSLIQILMTCLHSIIFGLLAENSGSILFPIALHNLVNLGIQVIGFVK